MSDQQKELTSWEMACKISQDYESLDRLTDAVWNYASSQMDYLPTGDEYRGDLTERFAELIWDARRGIGYSAQGTFDRLILEGWASGLGELLVAATTLSAEGGAA